MKDNSAILFKDVSTEVPQRLIDIIDVEKEIRDFPMTPYNGRIFVVQEEVIKSGELYIPDVSKREGEMQTNIGVVVAAGEGVDFVKPGDRIFYGRFSGGWVMNQKYRVMNEEDILGRFSREDKENES